VHERSKRAGSSPGQPPQQSWWCIRVEQQRDLRPVT